MKITHIAGPDIRLDGRYLRQRCGWCGTLLIDYDLAALAVPVGQDPHPATWAVGALVAVDSGAAWTVEGEGLPSDACAYAPVVEVALDAKVTDYISSIEDALRKLDDAARRVMNGPSDAQCPPVTLPTGETVSIPSEIEISPEATQALGEVDLFDLVVEAGRRAWQQHYGPGPTPVPDDVQDVTDAGERPIVPLPSDDEAEPIAAAE